MVDVTDAGDYGEITATIWLFKGTDHFFFTCTKFNKDLNKDYLGTGTAAAISNFCAMKTLHPTYPKYDNVKIIIRPLMCTGTTMMNLSIAEKSIAQSVCKATGSTEKPQIQVLDSISYFNVTSSLEIRDTEFRGD
jgi:hypothetical protein